MGLLENAVRLMMEPLPCVATMFVLNPLIGLLRTAIFSEKVLKCPLFVDVDLAHTPKCIIS